MSDKKRTKVKFTALVIASLAMSAMVNVYLYNLDEKKELNTIYELLYRFVRLPSTYQYAKSSDNSNLVNSLRYFTKSRVLCSLILYKGEIKARYGSCVNFEAKHQVILKPDIPFGWSNLTKDYYTLNILKDDLQLISFVDNSVGFPILNGEPQISLTGIRLSRPHINDILIISNFIFIMLMIVLSFLEFSAKANEKSNSLHDFNHANQDLTFLAEKIRNSSTLSEAKSTGSIISASAALRRAALFKQKPVIESFNLDEAISLTLEGFQVGRSRSRCKYFLCSKGIFVISDRTYLMKILLNLFNNSYDAVLTQMFFSEHIDTDHKFSIKVLEGSNQATIVVHNYISKSAYYSLLLKVRCPLLFKNRGIKIVRKTLKSIGSKLNISLSKDIIAFSFSLPMETLDD